MEKIGQSTSGRKNKKPPTNDQLTTSRQRTKKRSLYNGFGQCPSTCCCLAGEIGFGFDYCHSMTTVPQRHVDAAVLIPSAIYNKHVHGCDILPSAHSKMYDAPKEKRSTSPHVATTGSNCDTRNVKRCLFPGQPTCESRLHLYSDAPHVPRSLHSEKGQSSKEKGCLVVVKSFATDSHRATTRFLATCSRGKGLLAGERPNLDSNSSLGHG